MLEAPQSRTFIAYEELKSIFGSIARRGWRPAFLWVSIYVVLYAYVIAPREGIAVDLGHVNTLASIGLGAFIMRGVEKLRGAH